jgi:hypothetical protein
LPPRHLAAAVLPVEPVVDPKSLHAARVGIEDFKLERTWTGHEFAAHGHSPDPRRDVSGEGVHFLSYVGDIEFPADDRGHVLEACARVG